MQPAIVRVLYPVGLLENQIPNYSKTNQSTLSKDNVEISLQYLNKRNLYYLAKHNKNPYTGEGVDPVLTVFKIVVNNKRADKIKINKDLIVLLDDQGHQYNALNLESFRLMFPSTYERSMDYNFLFGQTVIEPKQYSSDYYKKEEVKKNLFQGGYIYKKIEVTGILSFSRLTEMTKHLTIIIPDVELYKDKKIIKKIDFKFKFVQTVERIGH